MSRILRTLFALGAVAVLVAGVPWALATYVGWPLPSDLHAVTSAGGQLWRTGLAESTMIKALAVIVWIAWIRLALAFAVEAVALVSRRPARRYSALGSAQRLAGSLLTSLLLVASVGGMRGAGAVGVPLPSPHASEVDLSGEPTAVAAPAPAAGRWTVARNDSLWKIAEVHLGDGSRWREIAAANLGQEVAPGVVFASVDQAIQPGWTLRLPGQSVGEAVPAAPSAPAPATETVLVERGDSLSAIAARTLGSSDEWPRLWELNRGKEFDGHRFDDPNQLGVGWELEVPTDAGELTVPAAVTPERPTLTHAASTPVGNGRYSVSAAAPSTAAPVPVAPATCVADPLAPPPAAETGPAPAADAAPAVDAAPSAGEDHTGISIGFGAATLLATGGLSLVASRRRRRLREAPIAGRVPGGEQPVIDLERTLRAASAEETLARLDLSVRALHAALGDHAAAVRPYGALIARGGAITLLLAGEVPLAPAPFEAVSVGWRLPSLVATADIPSGSRFAPFPTPALCHVGTTTSGDLYLDLEALGSLGIEGPQRQARSILRAIAATLSVSPFAGQRRLLTVGLERHVVQGAPGTEVVADLETAIELAADAVTQLLGVLPTGESAATLRARSAGEPWEPVVLVATGDHVPPPLVAEVCALGSPPGRGFAVVSDAPGFGANWRLRAGDGVWRLEPIGIEVTPLGLEPEHGRAFAELLAEADRPITPAAEVQPGASAGGSVPFQEPHWELIVRTFGRPRVETCTGVNVGFTRTKSVELLAWLVRHRTTATRSGARASLWEAEVTNGTFANVVSDARQSLVAAVSPPEGEQWLERTLTERMVIHSGVTSDVELIEARLAHARRQASGDAIVTLTAALALVEGAPFAGTTYLWPDAEGHVSQDSLLVATVAAELAELCLDDGDLPGVVRATGVGLSALPGHEGLLALRMRAHAACGDLSSVKREWAGYERIVANDTFGDGEPAPQLLQLRRELLGTPRSAHAHAHR
jgi:LysM repeat protein